MFSVEKISSTTTSSDKLSVGAVYVVDCTNGDVTVTLSNKMNTGSVFFVKKEDDSDNVVIVDGDGIPVDGNSCGIEICIQNEAYMIVRSDDGWEVV